MNNIISPVCLPNDDCYDILGTLQVKVFITENVYQMPLNSLFLMAARKNTKRGFLFVSKILGKHIPVHPQIPLLGGAALAGRYVSVMYGEKQYEEHCNFAQGFTDSVVREETWQYLRQNQLDLPEKTLFIGFAETATALGHAMFSCFANHAQYIHTTRENILGIGNMLDFVEEHSHATEHYCYSITPELFENEDMIVLVDDEITTGKSALNFIKAIEQQYPRKRYGVVSILDWRSPENKQSFAKLEHELGITIQCIALASGHISVTGEPTPDDQQFIPNVPTSVPSIVNVFALSQDIGMLINFSSMNTQGQKNHTPYLHSTGRFGLTSQEQAKLEDKYREAGLALRKKRQGNKTLCLGIGEFMYIPFKLASYMGEGVMTQSTTRSPIYPVKRVDYGVNQAITFTCPYDPGIINYLYNVPVGYYDEVFIFLERAIDTQNLASLLQALTPLAIPHIHCVHCVSSPS